PDFEYKYDRAGNLRFELDPVRRGAGSSYLYTDYDAQGRAVEIGKTTGSFASANPDAATTGTKTAYRTFAYSGSQLLEETAPGAATYRYGYDANGRVGSIVADIAGLGAKHIDYAYDNTGRVTKVAYQAGVSGEQFYQWFEYDEVGQLLRMYSSETDNKGSATLEAAYTYDARGLRQTVDLGTSAEEVGYAYHIRGWMTSIA